MCLDLCEYAKRNTIHYDLVPLDSNLILLSCFFDHSDKFYGYLKYIIFYLKYESIII